MSCPCGGKATGDKWHRRRGEPVCAAAREAHNARRRARRVELARVPRPTPEDPATVPWIAGASLYVPDYDPL